MNKLLFSVLTGAAGFFILSTHPVYAGGGYVYLRAYPNVPGWSESRMYIVHAYVSPAIPCRNVPITFTFSDPKPGDRISVGSDTQPYYIQQSNPRTLPDGREINDCSTYAKVFSGTKEPRTLYTKIGMPDGSVYESSKVMLYFDQQNPVDYSNDPINTPWDEVKDGIIPYAPTPVITDIYISSDLGVRDGQRVVHIAWSSSGSDLEYKVYKQANGAGQWEGTGEVFISPNTTLYLNPTVHYNIYVEVCSKAGHCSTSPTLIIPSLPSVTPNVQIPIAVSPQPLPTPTVIPGISDNRIEEFQQKIDDLQKQLDEQKMKQNTLEQKFNDFVSWVKGLFRWGK